jgi:hypothetical protein
MNRYMFNFKVYFGGKERLGDYAVMYPNDPLMHSWGDWIEAEGKAEVERLVMENWPDAVDIVIRTEDEVNPPLRWGDKEAA